MLREQASVVGETMKEIIEIRCVRDMEDGSTAYVTSEARIPAGLFVDGAVSGDKRLQKTIMLCVDAVRQKARMMELGYKDEDFFVTGLTGEVTLSPQSEESWKKALLEAETLAEKDAFEFRMRKGSKENS